MTASDSDGGVLAEALNYTPLIPFISIFIFFNLFMR